MPDDRDDATEFLMGSGAIAFPFDEIGDRVEGTIVAMQKRQQTDMQTGEPAFFANGDPKYMLQVSLQTELQNSEDDEGLRSVYLRGGNYTPTKGTGTSSLNAVRDAIKKSKAERPEIGAWLSLAYTGESKNSNKGFNAAKLYTAEYKPPSYGVDLNEMA
jgi:hypothetical protein